MNKKYLSALVCGFGASVLTAVPGFQSISCCLIIPVAAGVSIFLYKKSQPDLFRINTATGVILGLLTAIVATVFATSFELIISFITKSNDLVTSMPQAENVIRDMNLGQAAEESIEMMRQMVYDIQTKGFSFLYALMITLTNLVTYSIFGIFGGIAGTAIVNKRIKSN